MFRKPNPLPPVSAPRSRPVGALIVTASALALEALALLLVVVIYAVALVRSRADDLLGAVVTALLCLAAGAGLVLAARALLAGRRGARGPVLTWQLLQVLVAVDYVHVGRAGPVRWLAVAAIVVSVVAIVALFTPKAMTGTRGDQVPTRS